VKQAAELGYEHVEFWGWKYKDLGALAKAAKEAKVRFATFCMEADRRLVEPGAAPSLKEGLEKSIAAARTLGVDRLILTTGNERKAETYEITRRTVVRNLKALVSTLERENMMLVLEPLNPIVDHLGCWLTRMSEAADVCEEVGSPRVKILMDIYHQQVTEGNVIANLREYSPWIGHYHAAGVPGRHELAGSSVPPSTRPPRSSRRWDSSTKSHSLRKEKQHVHGQGRFHRSRRHRRQPPQCPQEGPRRADRRPLRR
jgi:hydroxypyruvate isomerase